MPLCDGNTNGGLQSRFRLDRSARNLSCVDTLYVYCSVRDAGVSRSARPDYLPKTIFIASTAE